MKFYGIKICNCILFDDALTSTDKLILSSIAGLTKKRGECIASDEYIANTLGVSWRTVSVCIAKAKELKYIDRLPKKERVRHITISKEAMKMNDGIYVRADILAIKDITSTEKIILAAIDDACHKEGDCNHTNRYFAQICNCTPDTVKKALTNLEKKGLVTRSTYGPSRSLKLTFRKIIEKGALRMVI